MLHISGTKRQFRLPQTPITRAQHNLTHSVPDPSDKLNNLKPSFGNISPSFDGSYGDEESNPDKINLMNGGTKSINVQHLMALKSAFEMADKDGSKGLDMDEFISAFGGVVGEGLTPKQLQLLFMKIDSDSNGQVSWDEFSTFMILENQNTRNLVLNDNGIQVGVLDKTQEQTSVADPRIYHKEPIQRIVSIPKKEVYVTTSRDGTLRLWRTDTLKHKQTIYHGSFAEYNNSDPQPDTVLTSQKNKIASIHKKGYSWITDVVYMAPINKLAVSTVNRKVSFYDTWNMDLCNYHISNLANSPLCLGYHCFGDKNMLLIGDDHGFLKIFNFTLNDFNDYDKGMKYSIEMDEQRPTLSKIHSDWINKAEYYTQLNAIVSCSADQTLRLSDIQGPKVYRVLSGHQRGVLSFSYSPSRNILASCGAERVILLWNPFITTPLGSLHGHKDAVLDLIMNENDGQLVSVAADRVIKIWDIRTQKCVQTFNPQKAVVRSEDMVASIVYDSQKDWYISGDEQLTIYPIKRRLREGNEVKSHEYPITSAIYNNNFTYVVTADSNSTIAVWEVSTGEKLSRFTNIHGNSEITSMTFDYVAGDEQSGRRLITGARDGHTIKVLNFNTGQKLKELQKVDSSEITAIKYIYQVKLARKLIVAVGWNKTVSVWQENIMANTATQSNQNDFVTPRSRSPIRSSLSLSQSLTDDKNVKTPTAVTNPHTPHNDTQRIELIGHTDDVLCVDFLEPNVLATGSYDTIILWNLDSGVQKHSISLNALDGRTIYDELPAVEKLLFLPHRKKKSPNIPYANTINFTIPPPTPLLSCGNDGFIRIFNPDDGKQLLKIESGHPKGESVVIISTDLDNNYLFSGDSKGYIKVWDISQLYIESTPQKQSKSSPLLIDEFINNNNNNNNTNNNNNKFFSLQPEQKMVPTQSPLTLHHIPPDKIRLLRFWRAHTQCLVSIEYVNKHQAILTASKDCTVRLWTLEGDFVGTFGQDTQWVLGVNETYSNKKPESLVEEEDLMTMSIASNNNNNNNHYTPSDISAFMIKSEAKTGSSFILESEKRNSFTNRPTSKSPNSINSESNNKDKDRNKTFTPNKLVPHLDLLKLSDQSDLSSLSSPKAKLTRSATQRYSSHKTPTTTTTTTTTRTTANTTRRTNASDHYSPKYYSHSHTRTEPDVVPPSSEPSRYKSPLTSRTHKLSYRTLMSPRIHFDPEQIKRLPSATSILKPFSSFSP